MRNPIVNGPVSLVLALMVAASAVAGDTEDLISYFPLEDSTVDASGANIFGQLIGNGGVAVNDLPEYVDGKFGRAIRFDGSSALRVPLDLDPAHYPKLSLTVWVFLEDIGDGCDVIASTGDGDGPSVTRCGRALELRVGEELLRVENALSPSQWNFVAGVWDYEAGAARLHWRTRSADAEIDTEELATPEPDLWIGAHNDTLTDAAKGVRIDELRIYSTALDAEGISSVRDSTALQGRLAPEENAGDSPPRVASAPRIPPRDALSRNQLQPGRPTETAAEQDNDGNQEEATPAGETGQFAPLVLTPIIEAKPLELKRRVVSGERELTPLTGNRGNIIKEIDFADRAIDSILWSEKSDKPCELGVSGRDKQLGPILFAINQCDKKTAQFACENKPCTGKLAAEYEAESAVRLGPGQAITAVRVCLNPGGERVKGIEIWGAEILDSGALSAHSVSDLERKPNCRDKNWAARVLCPSQQVATGIRAHFNEGKGPTANIDSLTGLELICRPTMRRSE